MASINPESIWVLSALDKLMADNKSKPEVFNALFEKKKQIIDLLQSLKIDAKKYKAIVVKAYKEETGDVKRCAELDILKCKDMKDDQMVELWFREMIENTGAPYEDQEKQYQANTSKKAPSPTAATTASKTDSNNTESLVSFKAIDNLLDMNEDNKPYYAKLL